MWNLDLIKMIYTITNTHTNIHIYGIKAEETMLRKWPRRKGRRMRALNSTYVQKHDGDYCFKQMHPALKKGQGSYLMVVAPVGT